MRRRLAHLLLRAFLAVMLAAAVMMLPSPESMPAWLAWVEGPVIVFVLICYLGKVLYDTLFYDHYRP